MVSMFEEAATRLLLIFNIALVLGVIPARAEEFLSLPIEPVQSSSPEEPLATEVPVTAPSQWPCHFGPIVKRISLDDVKLILRSSATRREAWNKILARDEDLDVEEIRFRLAASDDGLGNGLVCPEQ